LSIEHMKRALSHKFRDVDWRCSDMFVGFQIPPDAMMRLVSLRLCIDARSGRWVDVGRMWKRQKSRPRNMWTCQVKLDTGLKTDATWTAAAERDAWRALPPTAGQAVQ